MCRPSVDVSRRILIVRVKSMATAWDTNPTTHWANPMGFAGAAAHDGRVTHLAVVMPFVQPGVGVEAARSRSGLKRPQYRICASDTKNVDTA